MKPFEIQQRLHDLFQTNPIVLWNDAAGEFADVLCDLDLPGVEVFSDQDGNRFEIKATINDMQPGSRFLIYRSEKIPDDDASWFADATAYAPVFTADRASLLLEELCAADTPEMRSTISRYSSFLSKSGNIRRLQELGSRYTSPEHVALAIMALALGAKESIDPAHVIIAFLQRAHDQSAQQAWTTIRRAGAANDFSLMVSECLGYTNDCSDAQALSDYLILASLAGLTNLDRLNTRNIDTHHAGHAADTVRLWSQIATMSPDAQNALWKAASHAERIIRSDKYLVDLTTSELSNLVLFPCVEAMLISRLARGLSEPMADTTEMRNALEQRRASIWTMRYSDCHDALDAALTLKEFASAHREAYSAEDAASVWRAYTSDWFTVDAAYRHFHIAFGKIRLNALYDLDATFYELAERIESWYRGDFLRAVAKAWEKTAAEEFASVGSVAGVPRLTDFYLSHVDSLTRKNKRTWIIVSDALRYEVAHELADALEATTQGKTQLDSMQAPFPSITSCGMAALLPHDQYRLCVNDDKHLTVALDTMPTQGTKAREAILNAYLSRHRPDAKGVALQSSDFIKMNKADRKTAIGNATVIYLYHDRIDATGDKAPTEDDVFRACADTIDELRQLASLIVRDFRSSDILITADHGFLYTYKPLSETDKIPQDEIHGDIVDLGRRYAVGKTGLSSGVMLPISLDSVSGNTLMGLTPREAIRIKKAGGGDNYVHGGISLQELCVPVIHFKNYRSGMKGYVERSYVTLSLVTQLTAITNLTCSFELLQNEPAGGKVLPSIYEIALQTCDGEQISDIATIQADRTDSDPTKRTFKIMLHVRSTYLGKNGIPCQLVARQAAALNRMSSSDSSNEYVLASTELQVAFAPEEQNGWW